MFELKSHKKTIIWDNESAYASVRCDNPRQIKLVEIVNHLPVLSRQAILLYTFEGMQKDTIAAELGKTTAQIRKNMLNANDAIRQFVNISCEPAIREIFLNKLFKQWPYQAYAELLHIKTNAVVMRKPSISKYF